MSNPIIQFIAVGAVFCLVLLGSYPVMHEAVQQEQLNHYPDKLVVEDVVAKRRFAAAEAHPEKIDEYIAAGDQLASILIRQQQFDRAIEIYTKQLAVTWKLAPDKINPQYNDANLKLAGIFRDRGTFKTALVCYQSVLDLERKYLSKNDPKIARELNNIGLTHYLAGLGQQQEKDRQAEFTQAIDYYKQALTVIDLHPEAKTDRASTLWNLYLAQRDAGHKAEALDCRTQAEAIDQSMHRVCRAP